MSELPPSFRSTQWNGLFAPLNVAAYVTWVAVASGPALDWAHGHLAWSWSTRIGVAGLFAVLLLYILRCLDPGEPHDVAEAQGRRLVLLQAAAALLACWGLITCCGISSSSGLLPVLMIIVAGQISVLYSSRTTILLLLAINLPLAVLLAQRWALADVIPGVLSYGGFQAFAALTLGYAKRTEHARDETQRINAELLATRRLLLESARSEERLRLSRELHDVVGHKLTALKLQLRLQARRDQVPSDQTAAAQTIAECERLADELLTDVRGVVSTLRQHDGIDLQQALAALVPALPHPQVRLELAPQARAAGLAQAQALLRCAQEGLTNALRHSGAAHIAIRLAAEDAGIALSVEDDGRAQQPPPPGNGLRGMRERLEALGGRLELEMIDGGGLRLRAWLPQAQVAELPA